MEVESAPSFSQPGQSRSYREICDVKRLHWIIEHADQLDLGRSYVKGKYVEGDAQLGMLKKYYKRMIEGKGSVLQTYAQHDGRGRRFSEQTGLQNLSRRIRHTISTGLRDIDVSNAQPTLLQWYCERHRIPCPHLTSYNTNRDQYLADLMNSFRISKDQAKKILLKAMNKFQNHYQQTEDDPEWMYDFHHELRQISLAVMILNPEIEMETRSKRDYNVSGSTLNRILCDLENQVLTIMERAARTQAEVHVLCFDGMMVSGVSDMNTLLRSCEKAVHAELGIAVRILEKTMDEGYEIPPHELLSYDPWLSVSERKREERLAAQSDPEFLSLVHEFEKTHAKIISSSNFISISPFHGVVFMTRSQLCDSYEHLRYGANRSFISEWLKYPDIRRYERIDVFPTGCPENVYNLWIPFSCLSPHTYTLSEDVRRGRDFLLNHIGVLCNHDAAVTDYITRWIAQMLQYPEHKTRMPTFISEQGAGKDSFLEFLRRMMGSEHVMETTEPERDVWGPFNDALKGNTYLVCLNELSRKSTIDAEQKIKGLITDPWLYINPKGKGKYKIRSYHRFIAFTNSQEPLKTAKGDRRNIIIQCSNEKVGDTSYFNQYYAYLDDRDVVQACFDHLMSLDVATFHQLKNEDIPITDYQRDLQHLSVSPIEAFVAHLVSEDPRYEDSEMVEMNSAELLREFNEYLALHHIKYEINSSSLGVRLKNLKISGVETGIHTKSGNKIRFNRKIVRQYLGIDNLVFTR